MSSSRKKIQDRGKKTTEERAAEFVSIATVDNTKQHVLNTTTPCAACKLLRRRCVLECPFFPYFSPSEPQKFAATHKVYGASNVSKMLMVPEAQRADTARSLVYEANLRLQDPVYGCMGAIIVLQKQVNELETELRRLKEELLKNSYSVIPSSTHGSSTEQWPQLPEFPSASSSMFINTEWQNQNMK
ncbi:LOB domain-containing protein 15-like isoform X2 [Phalaenopsis equestris]|uniref:LOB domain-containing protein 15-like isoform X2 n=1 Tax=Phalaenopsis equestris TaxID=78828 RepID=UPI0009E24A88|nr:LOB domain-containing protein 15-like isoform X2 [Phalaenopsis equestris]